MRFEQIRRLLGEDAVAAIQRSIVSVLQEGGADGQVVCALREFLVAMLASVVTTRTYLARSEQLAAEDAGHLNALVRKIKAITPQSAAAVAEPPSNVIAFHPRSRPRTAPERASAGGCGPVRHGAIASAATAATAIARRKELTAQRKEILARSHALVARAQSLTRSIHGLHLEQRA